MEIPQLPSPPVELAVWWANQGWLVFPCRPDNKAPFTTNGFKDGMTDEAAIRHTWAKHPTAMVGGATGRYRSAVDLDCKPGEIDGRAVWSAVAAIDAVPMWTSVTPSGGQHRVYNKIENHPSIGQYPYFGFDIRNEGGYIILPGSVMQDGRRYELTSWDGDRASSIIDWVKIERTLKEENEYTKVLWGWHLLKEQQKKDKRDAESRARREALKPGAPVAARVTGSRLVAPLQPIMGGGIKADNPEAWARVLELVAELNDAPDGLGHREISRICFEAGSRIVRNGQADEDAVVQAFQGGLRWSYRQDGDERKVHLDIERCVRDGATNGRGEPWRSGVRTTVPPVPQPATPPPVSGTDAPTAQPVAPAGLPGGELVQAPILLPDEFFDGCPELQIIKQAAHNRMVSPTALAMTLLARIASMADHKLRLPALVGSHVGLSFYTVLTAKVGGGKSSTVNLAQELLGTDPTSTREVEVITGNGTGEGLIQKHLTLQEVEGQKQRIPTQTINNVFWYIDEGMNLVKEFDRRGSQAAGILCSGWFCAGVGQNNATGELQRSLRPLSYNWGIVVAIQDDNAHNLLAQQGIGLTQRCFWVEGWDPTIPDPDHLPAWPGALDWRHPPMPGDIPTELRGSLSAPAVDEGAPRHVKLPDWYEKEQKWALFRQKQTGQADDLSEHLVLMEIKLSVLVAMLRGHIDPTDDDIRRARIAIGAHKKQIRRAMNRVRVEEAATNRLEASRAEDKAEEKQLAKEEAVRGKVERKVVKKHAEGSTTTWREIRIAIGGRHVKELGDDRIAELVTELVTEGRIREVSRDTAGNPTYDTP